MECTQKTKHPSRSALRAYSTGVTPRHAPANRAPPQHNGRPPHATPRAGSEYFQVAAWSFNSFSRIPRITIGRGMFGPSTRFVAFGLRSVHPLQFSQPFFNRLGSFWRVGHLDLLPSARRSVGGIERLHYDATIFTACLECFLSAHAPREVPHFLGNPVIPMFLENRIAPANRGRGLFYGVAKSVFAIGG